MIITETSITLETEKEYEDFATFLVAFYPEFVYHSSWVDFIQGKVRARWLTPFTWSFDELQRTNIPTGFYQIVLDFIELNK